MVFIADDEDAFRDSTTELLEAAGYLVLPARNGVEALARMRGYAGTAVAVVDLGMPGMDGAGLIRAMRTDTRLRCIPIVVVTARDVHAVEGADRVLKKPLARVALVRAIEGFGAAAD